MVSCCRYGSVLISAWLGSRLESITTKSPMSMVTQPGPSPLRFSTFSSCTAPVASQEQTPVSSWEVSNALHCHRCSPLVCGERGGRDGSGNRMFWVQPIVGGKGGGGKGLVMTPT